MPGLHYQHKLPWVSLADHYRSYKHVPIKLPVGKCKKIHVVNNRVKHQLKNRTYLHDRICCDSECKAVVGVAEFRKNENRLNDFHVDEKKIYDSHPVKDYFFKKFREAVFDYIDTMKKTNDNSSEIKYPEGYDKCGLILCDTCDIFTMLIETKNFSALEKYDNQQLKEVFNCYHGAQTVGRNMEYLFYHIVYVYVVTNLIVVLGNVENASNWHIMKPDHHFRQDLMIAWIGQTFLPGCRKYLSSDVYMKDLDATKEMCKKLFEFMCIYTMLELKLFSRDRVYLNKFPTMFYM